MAAEAIPDEQQGALQRPMEWPNESEAIVAGDVSRGDGKIQAQALWEGRHRDRTGDGEPIMAVQR